MTDEDPASGQGSTSFADPHPARRRPHPLALALTAAGVLLIVGTYVWVITTRPASLDAGLGYTSLIILGGYLAGTVCIIAGATHRLDLTTLVLIPPAIAVNIVAGQLIGISGVPLYLDSIGTVLVAVVAGPAAGAATGALTNLVWGLFNPTTIPFAAGAALIGLLAGLVARFGLARRFITFVPAGFVTGIIAGIVAAPVAAFVFGGGVGVGTGGVVAALQAAGQSMLGATTIQSLLSDPLDKAIVFTVVLLAVRVLPPRVLNRFAFARDRRSARPTATAPRR